VWEACLDARLVWRAMRGAETAYRGAALLNFLVFLAGGEYRCVQGMMCCLHMCAWCVHTKSVHVRASVHKHARHVCCKLCSRTGSFDMLHVFSGEEFPVIV